MAYDFKETTKGKILEERDLIWCCGLNFGVAQWLERLVHRTKYLGSIPGTGANFTPLITILNVTSFFDGVNFFFLLLFFSLREFVLIIVTAAVFAVQVSCLYTL